MYLMYLYITQIIHKLNLFKDPILHNTLLIILQTAFLWKYFISYRKKSN